MARASLRLLSLNMAFIGGIHYGLGAAMYEIAMDEKDFQFNKYQMLFSFVPAAVSLAATSFMLFASPLTVKHVTLGFTSLMLAQLVTVKFDRNCVDNGMAPVWFKKFRSNQFYAYMALTIILFAVFYRNVNLI